MNSLKLSHQIQRVEKRDRGQVSVRSALVPAYFCTWEDLAVLVLLLLLSYDSRCPGPLIRCSITSMKTGTTDDWVGTNDLCTGDPGSWIGSWSHQTWVPDSFHLFLAEWLGADHWASVYFPVYERSAFLRLDLDDWSLGPNLLVLQPWKCSLFIHVSPYPLLPAPAHTPHSWVTWNLVEPLP